MVTVLLAVLLCGTPTERLAEAGLEVHGPLDAVDLEGLEAGLQALPVAFRRAPGPVIRLTLDSSRTPSATGIAEPEWNADAFVLTLQQGQVNFRDGSLEADARRRLWRARAVVHAILTRWDERLHWSQKPEWRRINGWLFPFERPLTWSERPLNQAVTAYARPRGQVSAQLDLLTFAEAALVPVDSVARDDQLICQDFTRSRVLGELLGITWPVGVCPAFEAWAQRERLESVEVLLVQASGRAPESLFGHLLLRPVWKDSVGPSFDAAVQFAALSDPRAGLSHIARGLFGGYSMGVFTISMTDLVREKLSSEQRGMTRWRLALNHLEQLRLMERIWELERRGRFDYAFFSDNCGSLLVWILQTALDDPQLARWPGFITSPAAVLDDLFRAKRANGERLLTEVLPSFESTGAIAQADETLRRELDPTLPFAGLDLRSADSAIRSQAYVEAERRTRSAPVSLHRALFRWWALTVRIERAAADQSLHERRVIDDQRIEGPSVDLDAMWTQRLHQLERESVLQDQLMMLDREQYLDDVRRRASKRAPTDVERAHLDEATAQLELFHRVAELHAGLADEVLTSQSGESFLRERAAAAELHEASASAHRLPVSGHFRTAVGAGIGWSPAAGGKPWVRIEEAGLLELLGEQRARGLGAHVGVRMLEGGMTLAPTERDPFVQSHFTLVAFDSIAAPLPLEPSWREHLGFGFELTSDHRQWRSVPTLMGGAGWVFAHWQSSASRQLLAIGVGPAAWVGLTGSQFVPLAGATARLVARVPLELQWPSALRLEVREQSLWGPGRVLHELRGELGVEWVLAWNDRPRVLVRPSVAASLEPMGARVQGFALLMIEPAIELR